MAYSRRAAAWDERGEFENAIADYTEAIRLESTSAPTFNNRGYSWFNKKDFDKAIADYTEAIRLDPNFALAFHNRGISWFNKKDFDKAIADYTEAIRLDPKDDDIFNNRGIAWFNKKDYDKAIIDHKDAIRLNPKGATACNCLAWVRSTCPKDSVRNGKEAVEFAMKACELTNWKEPKFIGTLGAACAESGRFEDAIKVAEEGDGRFNLS